MPDLIRNIEVRELKKDDTSAFNDIKPAGEITDKMNKEFSDILQSPFEVNGYVPYQDKLKRTPENSGEWTDKRGESRFKPLENTEKGKKAIDALKKYNLDGIDYKNAEPDFSKCSETTSKIDNMTEIREGKGHNFDQADTKCAKMWNEEKKDGKVDWTPRDIYNWRKKNNFSWHERCDMETMDLVPFDIHDFFKHSGGCAECKAKAEGMNVGGIFDE